MSGGGYKAVIRAQRKLAEGPAGITLGQALEANRGMRHNVADLKAQISAYQARAFNEAEITARVRELEAEAEGLRLVLLNTREQLQIKVTNEAEIAAKVDILDPQIREMVRINTERAGLVDQLTKERDTFERAAVQLQDQLRDRFAPIVGGHTDPADCPTYYDGCNCSVENLIHNIERAEEAERKLDDLQRAATTTAEQCDVMRARVVMDHGDVRASKLMGQMAGMFRAVLEQLEPNTVDQPGRRG